MRGMDRDKSRGAHQGDRPALRPRRRRRQAGRRAVQGLPPARRAGAGDAARPGHPHPRRADQRPRPQPDRRDPVAHQGDRPREDGHPLDAHPAARCRRPAAASLIISGGKLVADGTPDELRARETRRPLPGGRRVQRRRQGRDPRPARQPGGRRALRGRSTGEDGRRTPSRIDAGGASRPAQADLPRRRRQPLDAARARRASRPASKTSSATSPPATKSDKS